MDESKASIDSSDTITETQPTATAFSGIPTASDLFNREVDLQKIDYLNGRVLHLQAENEALRERHEKREQDTHEFVAYFQKEIQTRDKQITKLTEELAALKLSHALELEASQQTKENENQQLQQHFSSREEKFTEELFFLKEELNQLETFKEMRETIYSKMKDIEGQLQEEKESSKEQIGALERKFLEEKARLQKEHEKKIEIVKQQAKEDARNGLDADTRKVVTDNRRMGEELRFQLQMSEELQKEKKHFEEKAKKYYMDMQISKSKEEEYAAAAQKQAREIRQLRGTIKNLEKRMSENLAELEREKFIVENRNGKDLEEMSLDIDGLRRLVRLKNKELRNLRRLAQTVLDQRTDIEVFFLDALEYVKDEIEKEKKRQLELEMERYQAEKKKVTTHSASPLLRFPKLNEPNTKGSPTRNNHFSDKVDIHQLGWEEKERVLRLLFARINGIQSYADANTQQPPVCGPPFRAHNQESQISDPIYFVTEPEPTGGLHQPSFNGPSSNLSMSLRGLPICPTPPMSSSKRKH